MSRDALMTDLSSLLGREVDLDAWLAGAAERLTEALEAERATIWLVDGTTGELVTRVAVLPEVTALRQPLGRGVAGLVAQTGTSLRIDDAARDARFDPSADRRTGFVTRSIVAAPLRERDGAPVRGVVQVLNKVGGAFTEADEDYLRGFARDLSRALTLTTLAPAHAQDPGLELRGPFNRIVGRSAAMEPVYERVALAAGTDATVLLRGETGTGKTLLARAIHVNSPRRDGPFVTVDCTTLPAALFESEIFGHERGAFTGADRRVLGRVEGAHGGTLFLDEIGELPLEIQGKLLRFLQDRAFERVGGRQTLTADARIVAATHVDLEAAVEEKRFREDLYYRLRVVEIEVPPLRARGATEIERLARHFVEVAGRRHRRPDPRLSDEAIAHLRAQPFPGNVRELEHWIESAVVLAEDGKVTTGHLPVPRRALRGEAAAPGVALPHGLRLEEASARYVRAAVEAAEGNQSEAARTLGVSRNTVARALKGR